MQAPCGLPTAQLEPMSHLSSCSLFHPMIVFLDAAPATPYQTLPGLPRVSSAASMRPGSSLRPLAAAEPVQVFPGVTPDEVASAVQMLRMLKATQSVGGLSPSAHSASAPEVAEDSTQRSLALLALAQGSQPEGVLLHRANQAMPPPPPSTHALHTSRRIACPLRGQGDLVGGGNSPGTAPCTWCCIVSVATSQAY